MARYRYRYEGARSHEIDGESGDKRLSKIDKLGKLLSIKGYRFISTRSYMWEGERRYTITDYERILVRGEHGTARFSGVCWSYSGQGPRATIALLVKCGVPKDTAQAIAFGATRHSTPGVDWELNLETLELSPRKAA